MCAIVVSRPLPLGRAWVWGCPRAAKRIIGAALAAVPLLYSTPGFAGCLSESRWCSSNCSTKPSLFGGMNGGFVGGVELSQCHSDCDRKYKICLAKELATPEGRVTAAREAKHLAAIDAEIARQSAERQRQFEANLKKAVADSETAQRTEFRLLMDWYHEYGDFSDNRWPGASSLPANGDAIVRVAVPMRELFPRPSYGADGPYEAKFTQGIPANKLNSDAFHIIGILPVGTRVHITALLHSGAAEVTPVDGDYAGMRGQMIAGALSADAAH